MSLKVSNKERKRQKERVLLEKTRKENRRFAFSVQAAFYLFVIAVIISILGL